VGRYSGNLVRTWARPDDIKNPLPDTRHQTRGHEADGTDEYPERHQVPADTGSEYFGTTFPDDVTAAPGVRLAEPDWRTHQGSGGFWPVYSDDQWQQQLAAAHGATAERSDVGSQYAAPPVQSAGEVYGEVWDDGQLIPVNANTEGSPVLLRGINAYPLNNPERVGYVRGVRPGQNRRTMADAFRRLGRRRYVYDMQPLTARGSDLNVPQPVPAPGNGRPPYYGPVLQSVLPDWMQPREVFPAIWRDPGKVDDSQLAASPSSGGYEPVVGGDL